jgi:hypothetical protein
MILSQKINLYQDKKSIRGMRPWFSVVTLTLAPSAAICTQPFKGDVRTPWKVELPESNGSVNAMLLGPRNHNLSCL